MADDNNEDDGPDTDDPAATYEELLSEIAEETYDRTSQAHFERQFAWRSLEQELTYAHLKGLTEHYKHKGKWSWFLMGIMALMVIFQSVLMGLVGAGLWDYSQYKWLLPLLLVQNFAQIVGLALFVVKALFSEMKIDIRQH